MTKLVLNVVDFNNDLLFDNIKLSISGEKIEVSQKKIEININYSHKYYNDSYIEIIELYKKNDKSLVLKYKLELYFNQTNSYDIMLNSKNNFSFDILLYYKDHTKLPNEIKYQNEEEHSITNYDSFGLKSSRKFGFINCEKDWIIKSNKEIHFPSYITQGSYYINIYNNNNENNELIQKASLYRIHLFKSHTIDFNSINPETKKFLYEYEENIFNYYEKLRKSDLDIALKNNRFHIYIHKDKEKFEQKDFGNLYRLSELLSKRLNLKLSTEEFRICLGYCLYLISYELYEHLYSFIVFSSFINHIQKLNKEIPEDLEILRFIFWYRNEILNKKEISYTITSNITKIMEEQDQNFTNLEPFKLVLPLKAKENTPYNLSIKFINNFIKDLREDSFLTEILFLIDSEVSTNRAFKLCRMFKLSMLSLEKIKEHLILLIPKIIIRLDKSENNSSNGSFLPKIGIMRVYEGSLFKMSKDELDTRLIETEDIEVKYTIPLIMLIFHECFCHAKIRRRNANINSPSYFCNPYNNYNILYHCELGECGRIFEYYISPNIEVIKFLKYSLISMPELLNTKYWVSSTRKELWDYMIGIMDKNRIKIKDDIKYFPNQQTENQLSLANKNENEDYEINFSSSNYDSEEDSKIERKFKKIGKDEINCQ